MRLEGEAEASTGDEEYFRSGAFRTDEREQPDEDIVGTQPGQYEFLGLDQKFVAETADRFEQDLFLAIEVIVDRSGGEVGQSGDIGDLDVVVGRTYEQAECGGDDLRSS